MAIRKLLGRYDTLLRDRPISTNIVSGLIMGFLGDQIAERAVSSLEPDPSRTISVTLFQGFYQGGACRIIYGLYDTYFPKALLKTKLRMGLSKCAVDQFLHVPLLYTPLFLLNDAFISRLVKGDWANGDRWGLKS